MKDILSHKPGWHNKLESAYCSLRNEMGGNEMERNEMGICSLRNGNL